MGKISDFFSMSKQERVGAWIIALLIVALLVAVFIERRCSNDDAITTSSNEVSEYIEKAEKTKPKEKEKKKKKNKDEKKQSNKKEKKQIKESSKKDKKKKSNQKNSNKKSANNSQRSLEPVPQF